MKYLGYIDKSQNFYNFFPLGSFDQQERLSLFTDYERKHLFQDRNKHNYINLYFKNFEVPDNMEDLIQPLSLVVLSFDPPEEESKEEDSYGYSRYSVDAVQAFEREDLVELDQEGFYIVLDESALENDLNTTRSVRLEEPEFYILPGSDIFVRLRDSKALTGPFRVHHTEGTLHDNGYYFILPELSERKYQLNILKGTRTVVVDLEGLDYNSESIPVQLLRYPESFDSEKLDLSTDEQLLNDFQRSLQKPGYSNSPLLKPEEFSDLLNEYNTSLLGGKFLDKKIIESRKDRLFKVLSSNAYNGDLTERLNAYFADVLFQNGNDQVAEDLVRQLFEKNPDLQDQFLNPDENEKIRQSFEEQQALFEQKEKELNTRLQEAESKMESVKKEKEILELKVIALKDEILTLKDSQKKIIPSTAVEQVMFFTDPASSQNDSLLLKRDELLKEIERLEVIQKYLLSRNETLENGLQKLFSDSSRLIEKSLDGFYYNGLKKAAWQADQEKIASILSAQIEAADQLQINLQTSEEIIQYLIESFQAQRPGLSENEIINLILVFCLEPLILIDGKPGSGKTSLVQILAKSLGLIKAQEDLEKRGIGHPGSYFTQVNVERGWNNKRDWLGFQDPESEKFYPVNEELYHSLKLADQQNLDAKHVIPTLILLDKANHSQMLYYLSDFLESRPDGKRRVQVGSHEEFEIPESLHFIATLNRDSSLEPVSDSILDRSVVVSLEDPEGGILADQYLQASDSQIIDWNQLESVFIPEGDNLLFSDEIEAIWSELKEKLADNDRILSRRSESQLRKYWKAASRLFKKDNHGILPEYIALDYAISQYLLPKIRGSYDEYEILLEDLINLFRNYHLERSLKYTEKLRKQGQKDLFVQSV